MSNFIPPAAISAAASVALRPATEAALAKKALQLKTQTRTQDVADVDESGPDAVNEDPQKKQNPHHQNPRHSHEDQVDIASLDPTPTIDTPTPAKSTPNIQHLDISA